MNLLEELAHHLEFCGFGTVASEEEDGNIHWARMPDSPDSCICVYSTDSGVPTSENGARIQIMNRSNKTREAYETSADIANELDGFHGFLNGNGRLVRISVENAACGIGTDTKKREMYTTNLRVHYCY